MGTHDYELVDGERNSRVADQLIIIENSIVTMGHGKPTEKTCPARIYSGLGNQTVFQPLTAPIRTVNARTQRDEGLSLELCVIIQSIISIIQKIQKKKNITKTEK